MKTPHPNPVELIEESPETLSRKGPLFLTLAGSAFAVLIAEILLRILFPAPSGNFIHPPHLVRTFHPLPQIMPGVSGESEFRVNSLGVRGNEPLSKEGERILVLGGSTTECLYLDQKEAWPALLEESLQSASPTTPVWVGNAGKTGVSTREHRLQTPILLDDIAGIDTLILLTGVNDVLLRLAVDEKYDPDFVVQPGSRDFLMKRAFDVVKPATAANRIPFFPRRFVGLTLNFLGSLVDTSDRDTQTHLIEDRSGEFYDQRRLYREQCLGMREVLPDLSTGLREFERNLIDCLHAAKHRGVAVRLVSQPVLWSGSLSPELESLLWTGGIGSISGENLEYYSASALATAMARYNERMRDVADTEGADFLDLAAMLPKDATVFYDDCHFNEEGSRKVAKILANWILKGESHDSENSL